MPKANGSIDVLDAETRYIGFPSGFFSAPSFSGAILCGAAIFGSLIAFAWSGHPDWLPVALACLSLLLLIFQFALWISCRFKVASFARLGLSPNDLIAVGSEPARPYRSDELTHLLESAFKSWQDRDLSLLTNYLVEPHQFNIRIKEEIEPDYHRHRLGVIKEVRYAPRDEQASVLLPIAEFQKGEMLEGFTARVNGKEAVVMSVEGSIEVISAALTEQFAKLAKRNLSSRLPGAAALRKRGSPTGIQNLEPVLAALSRVSAPRSQLQGSTPLETAFKPGLIPPNAESLVSRFSNRYLLLAQVPKDPGGLYRIEYSRNISSKKSPPSSPDRRVQRRWRLRFKSGQFPSEIEYISRYSYESQSYHLSLILPNGLFVGNHQVLGLRRTRSASGTGNGTRLLSPPYARVRRLEGSDRGHFYCRSGHRFHFATLRHTISVEEIPYTSLRLAATLAAGAFIGVVLGSLQVVGETSYGIRSLAVPVLVSVPGIVAAWTRQIFAPQTLQRACLTTLVSLRLTMVISFSALLLSILQDAGLAQWRLLDTSTWSVPTAWLIRDGIWVVLEVLAFISFLTVFARYRKRRRQYLAVLARSARADDRDVSNDLVSHS
jgi:hypothetical protein